MALSGRDNASVATACDMTNFLAFRCCAHVAALCIATLATSACLATGGPTGTTSYPDGLTRVLFIGNSFTYVEDVPSMLEAIARQDGDTTFRTTTVAFANAALEDHWHEGSARRVLERSKWEYVVMQQGPSSLPASQQHLAYWTQQFTPLIRGADAEPVLYQVWPHISRPQDFPAVRQSYAGAAAAVDGVLAPAGAAWYLYLTTTNAVPLYAADGLHASRMGAYLAALVLYASVRSVNPESLPDTIPGAPAIAASAVRALQAAAAQTVAPLSIRAAGKR
jgi:hypothetical protein